MFDTELLYCYSIPVDLQCLTEVKNVDVTLHQWLPVELGMRWVIATVAGNSVALELQFIRNLLSLEGLRNLKLDVGFIELLFLFF